MPTPQNLIFNLCVKACNRDDSWKNDLATFGNDDLTQEMRDEIKRLITRHSPLFDDPSLLVEFVASQDSMIMPTQFSAPAAASRVDKTLRFITPTINFGDTKSVADGISRKDNIPWRVARGLYDGHYRTVIGQEPLAKKGVSAFIVKILHRGFNHDIIIGVTKRKIEGTGSGSLDRHSLGSRAGSRILGPKLALFSGRVNEDDALTLPEAAIKSATYVTVIVNTNSVGSIRFLLDGRELCQEMQPFLFPQHFAHIEDQTEWRPCVSLGATDTCVEFVRAQELPAYFNSFNAHNHLVAQTRSVLEAFKPSEKFEKAFNISAERGKTFPDELKKKLNKRTTSVVLSSPSGHGKTSLRNFMVDILAGEHATGDRTVSPAAGTAGGQASLAPDCYAISNAFDRRPGRWNTETDGDMDINDEVGLEREPTQYKNMFRAYVQGRLGPLEPFPSVRDYPGGGQALEEARRKVLTRDVATHNAHASCIIFPISADSIFNNNRDAIDAFKASREMCQTINRHPVHVKDASIRNAAEDRVPGGVKPIPYKVVVTKIFSKFPNLPRHHLLNPQDSPTLQLMYRKLVSDWNVDLNNVYVIGGLKNTAGMDFSDNCDGNKDPEIIVVRQLLLDVALASSNFLIPLKTRTL